MQSVAEILNIDVCSRNRNAIVEVEGGASLLIGDPVLAWSLGIGHNDVAGFLKYFGLKKKK